MKKQFARRTVIFLFVAVFMAGLLVGCETCKGVGRDIKDADSWIKDHLW